MVIRVENGRVPVTEVDDVRDAPADWSKRRLCAGGCGHVVPPDFVACLACKSRLPAEIIWHLRHGDRLSTARRLAREWLAGTNPDISILRLEIPRRKNPGYSRRVSGPVAPAQPASPPVVKSSKKATRIRVERVRFQISRKTRKREVYGPAATLQRAVRFCAGKLSVLTQHHTKKRTGRTNVVIKDVIVLDDGMARARIVDQPTLKDQIHTESVWTSFFELVTKSDAKPASAPIQRKKPKPPATTEQMREIFGMTQNKPPIITKARPWVDDPRYFDEGTRLDVFSNGSGELARVIFSDGSTRAWSRDRAPGQIGGEWTEASQ